MSPRGPLVEIRVDDVRVSLAAGMTVRHALIAAGRIAEVLAGTRKARDRWGNELGLDGALGAGDEIHVR